MYNVNNCVKYNQCVLVSVLLQSFPSGIFKKCRNALRVLLKVNHSALENINFPFIAWIQ